MLAATPTRLSHRASTHSCTLHSIQRVVSADAMFKPAKHPGGGPQPMNKREQTGALNKRENRNPSYSMFANGCLFFRGYPLLVGVEGR